MISSAELFKSWWRRFGSSERLEEAIQFFGACSFVGVESTRLTFPDGSMVEVRASRCILRRVAL